MNPKVVHTLKKGRGYHFTHFDNGMFVETWYDRRMRLWVTQVFSNRRVAIGDVQYNPNAKLAIKSHFITVNNVKSGL
jgi:hypothetical protein